VLVPCHPQRGQGGKRGRQAGAQGHPHTSTEHFSELKGRLREIAPTPDQHDPASERYRWRQARRAVGIAQAHALRPEIQSTRALARAVGVNQATVRDWLKLTPPDPTVITELVAAVELTPPREPPPAPWQDWDEVRRVREDLRLYRTLFLHQPGI